MNNKTSRINDKHSLKFFRKYKPSDTQKSIISEFQILHIKWDDTEPFPPPFITCLANIEQALYFYPRDSVKALPTPDSVGLTAKSPTITGPKNKPIGLKFGKDYLMIKVTFHPTGLYRLLGIPMQKTVNTGLDATTFFSHEIKMEHDKLVQSSSYDTMIEIVSSFIDRQIELGIKAEEPIDGVAIKMLDPSAKHTLPEWASLACLSLRQFERSFTKRVGISPKMFLRIVRFENAMQFKNNMPEKSWSDIALECGYNDSSHLLREFRQFAEFAPGTLTQKQTSGFGDFPTG
ncbi:MAG: helix-turn-helix domain-containing protein [Bacteroidetes bacterium]|nr:helix-turn-helix domain-containing protein [Bacteroidota bacterium]MBU1371608.1 helix-turn-helix domain-containing protein [Bacteroidota bacterium]MBU1484127.1 helix-turn-helix domain-containing protein [Bacteroidota bacterium]MBU1762073.1 helix-turn-helix domain-containing protein [Bacteroidota bacterium]MBU2046634.1 helix-turn-helix domain-containing protein [Bacteroidota bacterium]